MEGKDGVLRIVALTVVFVLLFNVGKLFAKEQATGLPIRNNESNEWLGWNVYMYMDARNILGKNNIDRKTIEQIKVATKANKGITVYIDERRLDNVSSGCFIVKGGELFNIGKCDGDLHKFLLKAFSVAERKKHNILILWGTADTDYFGVKGKTAVSWKTIGDKIRRAETESRRRMDILMVDACRGYSVMSLMGLNGVANTLIASSIKVPTMGFPYGKILIDMTGEPLNVAKMIANSYIERYSNRDVNVAVVDMNRIGDIALKKFVNDICKHRVRLKLTESLRKRIGKVYVPIGYWCFDKCNCLCKKVLQIINTLDIYYRRSKKYSDLPVMPMVKVFVRKAESSGEKAFYEETLGKNLGDCVFHTLSNPNIQLSTYP